MLCAAVGWEWWHFRSASNSARQAASFAHKNAPDFALLPASQIQPWIEYFSPGSHVESWEPTVGDIEGAESNLSQISAQRNDIDDARKYFRQYLAVVVNGRRTIFLNAFCTNQGHENDWRKRLVFVYDGGKCFWHATYDPATQKFSELAVNGVA